MRRRLGCGWRRAARSGVPAAAPGRAGRAARRSVGVQRPGPARRGSARPGSPLVESGSRRTPPAAAPPTARPVREPASGAGDRRGAPAGEPGQTSCRAAVAGRYQRGEHPGQHGERRRCRAGRSASSGSRRPGRRTTYCSTSGAAGERGGDADQQTPAAAPSTPSTTPSASTIRRSCGGVPARRRDQREIPASAAGADREGRPDQQHHLQQPEPDDQHAECSIPRRPSA